MTTVAIIPARGGSKGIPGKNIRPLGGVPLVARSIVAAKAAKNVDVVAVSSDDPNILAVAERWGALPLSRPDSLSGDQASSESALLHGLAALREQGIDADRLIFLQCTSPFTQPSDVERIVDALDDNVCAFTVISNHSFLWREDETGHAVGINHDHTQPRKRRQDLPPAYLESGAVYGMRVKEFEAVGLRFCGPAKLILTQHPSFEIDSLEDWELAEGLAAAYPIAKKADVKLFVTDFDGVHTDDRVIVSETGEESVRCSRADGMGVELLRAAGIPMMILSKETNSVVQMRAKKLKVDVLNGIDDKVTVLEKYLKERGLTWDQIAYMGNDVNDLGCLGLAGLAIVPADARPEAKRKADVILNNVGGSGAVREACDLLIKG